MSGQKKSTVTLRNDLTEMLEEIHFDELGLVGDKIAPPINVSKEAARYPVLPRETQMKVPEIKRAADGSFNRGQWEWSDLPYSTEEGGHEEEMDLTDALLNEEYINEEEVTAQLAKQGLWLGNESVVASALFNETTWAGTQLGTNPDSTLFSNHAGATPCTDGILTVINEMDDATNAAPLKVFDVAYKAVLRKKNALGKKWYSLVMSDDLVDYILQTAEIISSVQYVEPIATMTADRKRSFLSSYLGFKEIVPVSALYDTSGLNEDARIGKFWSNEYCLIGILSNGVQSFKERCIARQPIWTKYSNSFIIEDYANDERRKRIYRARQYRGITVNTDYGLLLKNMKTVVDSATGI